MKNLTDLELHFATISAAKKEKGATFQLLEFLAEQESRRAYLERGYSSLWSYVHQALGYSPSQTTERVSAALLMRKVPEVREALEKETLNLTTASQIATAIRKGVSEVGAVGELVQQCAGKTTREVAHILFQGKKAKPKRDRVRAISSNLTRITLEVDEEFMVLLTRAKELRGNPGAQAREVLQIALSNYIERKEGGVKKERSLKKEEILETEASELRSSIEEPSSKPNKKKGESPQKTEDPNHQPLRAREHSRYISRSVKRLIQRRAGSQCEFIDPVTERRCQERHDLEFDHYPIPYAMGGPSVAENLRCVCPAHNLLHARKSYGPTKIGRHQKSVPKQ